MPEQPSRRLFQTMTIPQLKIPSATALACVLALGGMQTFGQPSGLRGSQKPAQAAPDAGERQAAPTRSADQTAQAVNRFAGVLKRHPAQRRAAGEHRLQLYMMDLVEGGTTLLADEPDPGLDYCNAPKWSQDGT